MGYILIVDANDIDMALLQEPLNKFYDIKEARTIKDTVKILDREADDLDLIILDLSMENGEGLDVLTLCGEKSNLRKIPIIATSSEDVPGLLIKGIQMGATDYIEKPYAYEIIDVRIKNVLGATKRLEEAQKDKELFKEIAEKDQMTGLYNKDTTVKLVERVLKKSEAETCAMLVADIDDFKFYNDEKGHLIGDHIIRRVAKLIKSSFRQDDIVGRIGGDEFVILLRDVPSRALARRKARDIIRIFNTNISSVIKKKTPISIGLAFGEEGDRYRDLFARADVALMNSKRRGKACFTEYGMSSIGGGNEITNNAVVLISRDRTVCHAVEKICDGKIAVIEVNQIEELSTRMDFVDKNIALIYMDLSRNTYIKKSYFDILNGIEKLKNVPKIAICKEGNTKQYITALENGAVDLEMTPISVDNLKRKTIKNARIISDKKNVRMV